MNRIAWVKQLLSELAASDASQLYAVCREITTYIEHNPREIKLTIGGLRAALERSCEGDELLIRAAFTLSFHPFQALLVKYKLYDETLSEVIQEISHLDYMTAVSGNEFVDSEGNDIHPEDLHRRTFPYFINRFTTTDTAPVVVDSERKD